MSRAAWDAPWNEFTTTLQVAIDSEEREHTSVLTLAARELDNAGNMKTVLGEDSEEVAARITLALQLKTLFRKRLLRHANPDSKTFGIKLSGMLVNEALGQVNWQGLAEHYLSIIRVNRRAGGSGYTITHSTQGRITSSNNTSPSAAHHART
jgi:hypothetical protein